MSFNFAPERRVNTGPRRHEMVHFKRREGCVFRGHGRPRSADVSGADQTVSATVTVAEPRARTGGGVRERGQCVACLRTESWFQGLRQSQRVLTERCAPGAQLAGRELGEPSALRGCSQDMAPLATSVGAVAPQWPVSRSACHGYRQRPWKPG